MIKDKFIITTLIYFVILLISSILDNLIGYNIISIITKILIILYCFKLMKKAKIKPFNKDLNIIYIIIAITPFLLNLGIYFGPINQTNNILLIVSSLIGIITTVLWEELHFRVLSTNQKKKLTHKRILLIVLMFGLTHFIHVLLNPSNLISELFKLVLYLSVGYLSLGIYLNTKNITYSLVFNLLFNITPLIFNLFSNNTGCFGNTITQIFFYSSIVIYTIVGYLEVREYLQKEKK